jgi:tetratricopeptide (TPR) repeat protein
MATKKNPREKKGSGAKTGKPKEPHPPSIFHKESVICIALFAIAFLTRYLFLIDITDAPTSQHPIIDSHTYLTLARIFAQDKKFTHEFFWQPFYYPLFLSLVAIITDSLIQVSRIIQVIIGSITCVLTYLLGREIFDRRHGIIAGLVACLYGPLIFFNTEHVAATWAAFWAVGLVYLFIWAEHERKTSFLLFLGIMGGLSVLTRPTFLPFFIVSSLWLLGRFYYKPGKTKNVILPILPVLCGFLIIILPVCFLNRRITGKFTFLPYSGGINLYIGNNEDYCKTATIRPGYEWDKLTALPLQSGVHGAWEEQAFFSRKVLEFAKTKTGVFLGLLGKKTLRFFSSREIPRNIDLYIYRKWSWILKLLVWKINGFGFPFGLVFPLALIGLYFQRRKIPAPFFLFILLFPLSVILVFPSSRYRIPLIPAICILGALGCVSLWYSSVNRDWRRLGISIGIFFAGLLLCILPGPFCEETVNYEAEMYYALGHQANESDDRNETVRLYARALELAPDLDDARNNLGAALVDLGALEDGIGLFREVLEIKPEREDVHNNLAMALVRLQKFDEAISHYERAIEINPHFTEAYYNLANCCTMIGENERAIQNYRTALKTNPDFVKASFNLANLYAGMGKLENAAKEYQEILAKEPGNIDARNNLANVLLMKKSFGEAESEFHEVLRIRPGFAPSLFGMGNLFFEKQDFDSALSYYKDAVGINPGYAQVYYKMANIFQIRGELNKAIRHYEKATDLLPEWDKPAFQLAWICASCKDEKYANPRKAVGIAEKLCVKTSWSNPGFLDLLAASYARAGRFGEAMETAQKAIRLAKENQQTTLSDEIEKRLELYRENKPFKDLFTIIIPYPDE